MPSTETEPPDVAVRKAARRKVIEDAPPAVSEDTKLFARLFFDHAEDETEVSRQGHADTRKAIHLQTKVFAAFSAVLATLFAYLVSGFMDLAGVNLPAASRAAREVTTTVASEE